MIKPVCYHCKRELEVLKNSVAVVHLTNDGKKIGRSKIDIDAIRIGDILECPVCKAKIITNYGEQILGHMISSKSKKEIMEDKENTIFISRANHS